MPKNNKLKEASLLVLLLATMMSACDAPVETIQKQSGPYSKVRVLNIDYGKPGAPVTVEYSLPEQIEQGQIFIVRLSIASATSEGTLRLSLSGEGALQILSQRDLQFDLQTDSHAIEVEAVLTSPGPAHLNMQFLEFGSSGQRMAGRSLSLPIVAPAGNAEKMMEENALQDGSMIESEKTQAEEIIEMPAIVR